MSTSLKLREARIEDAGILTQIAHDAKRHWGYPETWIERWDDDLTITSDYIRNNRVFVAEVEDGPVGFYALIDSGGKTEMDHMWVAPAHIGTGVGKELFLHAMTDAAARKVAEVQLTADPNAEGFYKKMGAYRIGETVSEIEGEPRILPRMTINPKG